MMQQPDALREAVRYYRSGEGRDALAQAARLPGARDATTFAGMGSSLYASYAVLPAFWQAGRRAAPVEAGEILHFGLPGWRPDGLCVAVSQSGESAETRAVAERVGESHPIIAVTNDTESALARCARVVLPMRAGEESAISTKTYTNTLGVLHLLKAALLGEDPDAALERLEAAAEAMERALRPDLEAAIQEAARKIDEAKGVHFIGRGPALAAAFVGALTIGEGARVTAVGLPAASFRHGPMELAGEGHAALLFMPDGPTRPLLEKLRDDLARAGSRIAVLTDRLGAGNPSKGTEIALGPAPTEAHFPFLAAIGTERILAAVAERRGLTPGDFRYGGKITAEE
jgi:glucosamine--fructose-6-phosphate aminotransferase (isomerizing)